MESFIVSFLCFTPTKKKILIITENNNFFLFTRKTIFLLVLINLMLYLYVSCFISCKQSMTYNVILLKILILTHLTHLHTAWLLNKPESMMQYLLQTVGVTPSLNGPIIFASPCTELTNSQIHLSWDKMKWCVCVFLKHNLSISFSSLLKIKSTYTYFCV